MPAPIFDPADFGLYSGEDFQYFLKSERALSFALSKYQEKLQHAETRLAELCDMHNTSKEATDAQAFYAAWIPYHKDLVTSLVHRVDYLASALALLTESDALTYLDPDIEAITYELDDEEALWNLEDYRHGC